MSFSTNTIGVFTRAGTTYRSVANAPTRVFCGIRVNQLSVSSVHLMPSHYHFGILYGFLALFVLLFIFFWPLCWMFFFDIRNLVTPLVSSNYSCFTYLYLNTWSGIQHDFYITWYFMSLNTNRVGDIIGAWPNYISGAPECIRVCLCGSHNSVCCVISSPCSFSL